MADPTTTVPEVSTLIPNINPPPQLYHKPVQKCPSCGGTDHSRRSSKKCLLYVPRASVVKEGDTVEQDALAISVVVEQEDKQDTATTVDCNSSNVNVSTNDNHNVKNNHSHNDNHNDKNDDNNGANKSNNAFK